MHHRYASHACPPPSHALWAVVGRSGEAEDRATGALGIRMQAWAWAWAWVRVRVRVRLGMGAISSGIIMLDRESHNPDPNPIIILDRESPNPDPNPIIILDRESPPTYRPAQNIISKPHHPRPLLAYALA